MNIADIIVLILIIAVIAGAVAGAVRKRQNGCGGDCGKYGECKKRKSK